MQSVPLCFLCMAFVIEVLDLHWGSASISIQIESNPTICNSTLQFEANRHIHATSTHWPLQLQFAKWRESVNTCHITYEIGPSQSSVLAYTTWALVSFSCTPCTRATGWGQKCWPPLLSLASTQNCWWAWLLLLCVVDWWANIRQEWSHQSQQPT
jgi:hypothetical protein